MGFGADDQISLTGVAFSQTGKWFGVVGGGAPSQEGQGRGGVCGLFLRYSFFFFFLG